MRLIHLKSGKIRIEDESSTTRKWANIVTIILIVSSVLIVSGLWIHKHYLSNIIKKAKVAVVVDAECNHEIPNISKQKFCISNDRYGIYYYNKNFQVRIP